MALRPHEQTYCVAHFPRSNQTSTTREPAGCSEQTSQRPIPTSDNAGGLQVVRFFSGAVVQGWLKGWQTQRRRPPPVVSSQSWPTPAAR